MSRHSILSLNIVSFTKIGSVGGMEQVSQSLSLRKPLLSCHNKEIQPKIESPFIYSSIGVYSRENCTSISFALSLLFLVILSSICTRFGVRIAVLRKV